MPAKLCILAEEATVRIGLALAFMAAIGQFETFAADAGGVTNLLRNPEFRFHARNPEGQAGGKASHNVACWNTSAWGDITVRANADMKEFSCPDPSANVVAIEPGKQFRQFSTLPEIGCKLDDLLHLSVRGNQATAGALEVRLTLMRIDGSTGTWSPADFGCWDKRVFHCQGRGELIRGTSVTSKSPGDKGLFTVKLEVLRIEGRSKRERKPKQAYENTVGVLVEFTNKSATDSVWIFSPCLTKGGAAVIGAVSGRKVPAYYRRMPNTIGKLMRGEPIHILALGSSIDTGDANPPLCIYDETPLSPTYKRPLSQGKLDCDIIGRPDLKHYLAAPKQYVKYTGRLRQELMRKFNLPVSNILLNAMSCGGSSIGESHSGFKLYADLLQKPSSANGHPAGKEWVDLYPGLFAEGAKPAPDLVVLGHGHNERIDKPDGIAVYEGAIRWFQKRYPKVEFLFCQWHTSSTSSSNIPPIPKREELCRRYGIPFINIIPVIEGLAESCNYYALCPDGGHPQAAAHYIWFKQIEQAFEMTDPLEEFLPQKRLPSRISEFTYGWEGDIVTFAPPSPRIRGTRAIIEDTAFNIWAGDGSKDKLQLFLDGAKAKHAGRGTQRTKRDIRNSSFVHGRLTLGDRHILEIVGAHEVTIHALDCKVCDKRKFFPVDAPEWLIPDGVAPGADFESDWGSPYGNKQVTLAAGESITVEVLATDISAAYVDDLEGGELIVTIDGKELLRQPTNLPFVDTDGVRHLMENRKGIRNLADGRHKVVLRAEKGSVRILGIFAYIRQLTF